jgi:hypothetical protein
VNESAGKRHSARCRPGGKWMRAALVEAAHAAARSKNTYLAAQYARLAGRRGPKRAAVAVAHSILVISYHLLDQHVVYTELGADFLIRRHTADAHIRRLVTQLEKPGQKVAIEPAKPAACAPQASTTNPAALRRVLRLPTHR